VPGKTEIESVNESTSERKSAPRRRGSVSRSAPRRRGSVSRRRGSVQRS
jgi:hypothetical protein